MITGDKITRFESSIYGIDSFEGLAEKWYDGSPKVFFVINKIANLNFNIVWVKGWFDETSRVF